MCVTSMILDHFENEWGRRRNPWLPKPTPWREPMPDASPYVSPEPFVPNPLTPEEIERVRELLRRAAEYDRANNQPDCELEDKKKRLKELARELGADITFPREKKSCKRKPS